MPVKLYKMDQSPPARAVMMACEILEIPLEFINVDLANGEHRSPDFLKINPIHTVPTLVDDDTVLHDSHAILMYLSDKYGNNDALYPQEVNQRALVNQKLFFNNSILFIRLRNAVLPIYIEGAKSVEEKYIQDIKEAYDFMEAFLFKTKFLAADHITIADLAAFPTVSTLVYLDPLDPERHLRTISWFKEMEKQPYSKRINAPGVKPIGDLIQNALK